MNPRLLKACVSLLPWIAMLQLGLFRQRDGSSCFARQTDGKHPEFKGNVATVYTNPKEQGGSGNGHCGGKAEVYMDVGEAMGKTMVELFNK